MPIRFINGQIYLGQGKWSNELSISSAVTETVDLSGNTLVPAFRDAHAHPLFAGREAMGVDVTAASSHEEIGILVKDFFSRNPDSEWIMGGSYDRSITGERTREVLDRYVAEVPVVLHANDHHTIWVNTRALEVAGLLSKELPVIGTGAIDLGADGLPNGILREFEATSLVQRHQPKPTLAQDIQALLLAEAKMLAAGIVQVQDAWIDRGMAEVYLAAKDRLQIDYKLALRADPKTFQNDLPYLKELLNQFADLKNIGIQAVKFFVDGVFGSATAAVSVSYQDGSHGDLNWEMQSLVDAISITHELGLQTHIHAIGDQGMSFALDALAAAPRGTLSPVIAHAELTSADLIARAKELNVSIAAQPYWAQHNGMLDSCIAHLGIDRVERLYAFQDMLSAGLNLAFSSDWPVSSYRPIEGIAVAVHRKSNPTQPVHNPSQAIALEAALDAYSSSICALFGEEVTGTDWVILEGDVKAKDLDHLMETKVLAVYKAGIRLLPHHQH